MLPTIEELQQMRDMDIMELDRAQLANAEDIIIDTEKSVESRIQSFIEQTKNPFALNVGDYILKIGFMEDTAESIDDRLLLLTRKKTQIIV